MKSISHLSPNIGYFKHSVSEQSKAWQNSKIIFNINFGFRFDILLPYNETSVKCRWNIFSITFFCVAAAGLHRDRVHGVGAGHLGHRQQVRGRQHGKQNISIDNK